jgi:hypothetical protein
MKIPQSMRVFHGRAGEPKKGTERSKKAEPRRKNAGDGTREVQSANIKVQSE